MIAILFVCLAVASAAPHYGSFEFEPRDSNNFFHRNHQHRHHGSHRGELSNEFFKDENIFDARLFWQDLATEMQKFDQILEQFYSHFPTATTKSGIEGNEYVITLNLNGFDEQDIKVKAKEGILMVQAVHKSDEGSQSTYLDVKTLPSYVNVNGTWTYDMGVLKITFPLNSRPEISTETEEVVSEAPENKDREEMGKDNSQEENKDADVGLDRGDKDNEILTNVIPKDNNYKVEATTYAVDLKNEVEFVPVKY